jgi:universal stress protein A
VETTLRGALLVPTDMSDTSLPAVAYAADLARQDGTTLVLLHVVSPRQIEEEAADGRFVDRQLEEIRGTLLWWFTTFVPPASRYRVDIMAMARVGHPHDEILAAARTIRPAMIVMATHGRSGLSRAVLGSVAEAIVRHAPCPVLTISPTALRNASPSALRGVPSEREVV